MPTLEGRVSLIEERLKDQSALIADIRSALTDIRSDIRHLGEHMDRRFEQVDCRFERMDRRIEQVEHRFGWLVGIVLTGFVAVMGGLLGVVYQLLGAAS